MFFLKKLGLQVMRHLPSCEGILGSDWTKWSGAWPCSWGRVRSRPRSFDLCCIDCKCVGLCLWRLIVRNRWVEQPGVQSRCPLPPSKSRLGWQVSKISWSFRMCPNGLLLCGGPVQSFDMVQTVLPSLVELKPNAENRCFRSISARKSISCRQSFTWKMLGCWHERFLSKTSPPCF